jgi:1-acyl-sn-glycerol-3-phosphate acyltransferase
MACPSALQRRFLASAVVLLVPIIVVVSPVLITAAAVADLIAFDRQWKSIRLIGMTLNYLVLEWVGLFVAFALWIGTGFGQAIGTPWSQAVHRRIQQRWGLGVVRAARRWLDLTFEIDGLDQLGTGPVLILSQHASFFDALLPTLLLSKVGRNDTRHVLKAELAWDPCLGVYGHRLPNRFVSRNIQQRDAQFRELATLAAEAGDDALIIFPEGTFFTAERAARANRRIAERAPDRHSRLRLRYLLPPRPGGLSALLRGRSHTRLLFVAHHGLEEFGTLRTIRANIPFTKPVRVRVFGLARDLPAEAAAQLRLIDEKWQEMDDWLATVATAESSDK